MTKNNFLLFAPKIVVDFLLAVAYWPLWWYSVGLGRLLRGVGHFLRDRQINLGITVWLKNLFTPMYGQRDFVSRLISFLVRLFQIIFRSCGLLFWLILCLVLIIVWLVAPLLAIYALIYQLFL